MIRTLRLLDLHQFGSITLKPTSSPFDPATEKEASRRDFLETLTQKMVMPVMPELAEQDYLITQVIADFLSTHPKLELNGILFPSAQNTMTSQDTSGRNVILFNKASIVLNAEAHFGGVTGVKLLEYDENSPEGRLEPEVWTKEFPKEESCDTSMWGEPDQGEPALKLDRNSIEICEVMGVAYRTYSRQVKQHIVPPKMKEHDSSVDF